jgi:ATP-dependent Lon protease
LLKDTSVLTITALSVSKDKVIKVPVQGLVLGNGDGQLTLTGNVGIVAFEAMQVAKTLCNFNSNPLIDKFNYHIHFGYPVVQKDGPSWGLACFILLSWLCGNLTYKHGVAATGELDLLGNVNSVFYLNNKVASWAATEIGEVIIPFTDEVSHLLSNNRIFQIRHVDELDDILGKL